MIICYIKYDIYKHGFILISCYLYRRDWNYLKCPFRFQAASCLTGTRHRWHTSEKHLSSKYLFNWKEPWSLKPFKSRQNEQLDFKVSWAQNPPAVQSFTPMTAAGGLRLQWNFTEEPHVNHVCHTVTLDPLKEDCICRVSLFTIAKSGFHLTASACTNY